MRRLIQKYAMRVEWHQQPDSGSLIGALPSRITAPRPFRQERTISRRVSLTEQAGQLPLWEGYAQLEDYPRATAGSTRSVRQVSTGKLCGRLLAQLVRRLRPGVVVEFGTAFGVSGMHWLAGLEAVGAGRLYTFEPNEAWAALAMTNLAAISTRYEAVIGTFEDRVAEHLQPGDIDIAFIDAIHTGEFVDRQFEIVRDFAHPGAVVVFDDIAFSPDMADCWHRIAHGGDVVASATVGRRLGVVELG